MKDVKIVGSIVRINTRLDDTSSEGLRVLASDMTAAINATQEAEA